jgi:uncharacterized protein YPO0396
MIFSYQRDSDNLYLNFGILATWFDDLEKDKKLILDEIDQNKETLKKIERGFVDTETKYVMNEFQTEEIYIGIKRNLSKQYQNIKSKIEDLNNHLQQIGYDKSWFDWVDMFGDEIRSKKDIPDYQKKEVLRRILQ